MSGVASDAPAIAAEARPAGDSQWRLIRRRFARHRLGQVGLVIVLLLILLAAFAPFFSPYEFDDQNFDASYLPPQRIHFVDRDGRFHLLPFVYRVERMTDPDTFELSYREDTSQRYRVRLFVLGWGYRILGLIPCDWHLLGVEEGGHLYILGTTAHGFDLLSRIIHGGRISLSVALLGALVTGLVGSLIGAMSGYYGGLPDMLLQRLVELARSFPQLALWMALSVAIPITWSPLYTLYGIVGIFALLFWPTLAREVRGKVLSYREVEFVLAARATGVGDFQIIVRHILPQVFSHIIVVMTITIPIMILAESALSFLGLGIKPPMASWGTRLRDAQNIRTLNQHAWMMTPGLFIILAVLGFDFLGDGLRDAVDPYAAAT